MIKLKNKGVFLIATTVLAFALIFAGCTSCVASCKEWESGQGGLDRDIRVYDSRTGETLYEFSGKSYIADGSGIGNVTLLVWENGGYKKHDFLGKYISVITIEK